MTADYLFNEIVDTHPNITGWCSIQKALSLAAIVLALRPKTFWEIGVFGGKSAIPVALTLKHIGAGKLIAIDPWQASASVAGMDAANAAWWSKCDHETIFRGFVGHVDRLGLVPFVDIRRNHSDDVDLPATLDALHIDGNHGPQVLNDAKRFGSRVRVGGIIIADDLTWSGGNVTAAAEYLKSIGFIELYRVQDEGSEWGVLQRVSMPVPISLPTSGKRGPSRRRDSR